MAHWMRGEVKAPEVLCDLMGTCLLEMQKHVIRSKVRCLELATKLLGAASPVALHCQATWEEVLRKAAGCHLPQ